MFSKDVKVAESDSSSRAEDDGRQTISEIDLRKLIKNIDADLTEAIAALSNEDNQSKVANFVSSLPTDTQICRHDIRGAFLADSDIAVLADFELRVQRVAFSMSVVVLFGNSDSNSDSNWNNQRTWKQVSVNRFFRIGAAQSSCMIA